MGTGEKVCKNGPGHMHMVAATPIYDKSSLKLKFLHVLQKKKNNYVNLSMEHGRLKLYRVYRNDDSGLTLTYFTQCQCWSLLLAYINRNIFR